MSDTGQSAKEDAGGELPPAVAEVIAPYEALDEDAAPLEIGDVVQTIVAQPHVLADTDRRGDSI